MSNRDEYNCKPYSKHSHRGPVPRHSTETSYDFSPSTKQQTQMQGQLQRSVEASKQMLYGTFGNVIAILEEFEKREQQKKGLQTSQRYQRSNIDIPDQRHKQFTDVKSNVETQILLFETQSKACPPEVRDELREDLKSKTLGWAAVRSEMGMPQNQETDRYVAKLYEILATGRTDHKVPSRKDLTEDVMRDGCQSFIRGDYDRQMLDQSFKNNPNKKAKAPDTRHSEMLDEGATRISNAHGRSDLDRSLRNDVYIMRKNGPRDLK